MNAVTKYQATTQKNRKLTVMLDDDGMEALKGLAEDADRSMSETVRRLIREASKKIRTRVP